MTNWIINSIIQKMTHFNLQTFFTSLFQIFFLRCKKRRRRQTTFFQVGKQRGTTTTTGGAPTWEREREVCPHFFPPKKRNQQGTAKKTLQPKGKGIANRCQLVRKVVAFDGWFYNSLTWTNVSRESCTCTGCNATSGDGQTNTCVYKSFNLFVCKKIKG